MNFGCSPSHIRYHGFGLILAHAKEDWGKGTLTLGRGSGKTILPLFPTRYQGENQDDGKKSSS